MSGRRRTSETLEAFLVQGRGDTAVAPDADGLHRHLGRSFQLGERLLKHVGVGTSCAGACHLYRSCGAGLGLHLQRLLQRAVGRSVLVETEADGQAQGGRSS
eukprot:2106716-Rhodomonas_salina.2